MKQWTTTEDFINYGKVGAGEGVIVSTSGFYSKGDGGAASWQKTNETGLTPSQTPTDTGGRWLTDPSGNRWDLVLNDDGSFNEQQVGGFVAAAKTLEVGGYLKVTKSVELAQGVMHSCSASVKIEFAPDVVISAAAAGFTAAKLLQFGGMGTAKKFEFYGGFLKGGNVPLSGAGEANDLLYITSFDEIYISRTDSDCETGSDSCIFTADYDYCAITSCKLRNAPDAGVYTSGPSNGSGKGTCYLAFNYAENCGNEGYTAKRALEKFIATSNEAVNCSVGIATAEADGIAPAQYIAWSNNIIKRCTNSILARLVKSGTITGNEIYEVGRDGGGAAGAGVLLQGSENIAVCGNTIKGWNPDNAATAADFTGYVVKERLFNAVTTYSTYNSIAGGTVSDIGKVVREEGILNSNNLYTDINSGNISGANYTIGSTSSVAAGKDITGAEWEVNIGGQKVISTQVTATDDWSYAIIAMREGGGVTVKRIKQGSANSGPGGVGRALYVDN